MNQPRILAPEELLKSLGSALQKARLNARLSVRDLGSATSVSPSHILRIESGEFDFTVTKFLKLCDALGLPAGALCEAALLNSGKSPAGLDYNLFQDKDYQAVRGNDAKRGFVLARLVHELVRIVTALHMSSNPAALARTIDFPFRPLDEKITEYAKRIEPLGDHISRLSIVAATWKYPVRRLKIDGLLDDHVLESYFQWASENADLGKVISSWDAAVSSTGFVSQGPPETCSQVLLDNMASVGSNPPMQSVKSVPTLIAKLKRLTKERGAKAALARKLNVSRQAVDQWLSGATTPSADIVIKVMNLK